MKKSLNKLKTKMNKTELKSLMQNRNVFKKVTKKLKQFSYIMQCYYLLTETINHCH